MAVRTKLETRGFSEYLERLAQAEKDIDQVAGEVLAVGGDVLLDGMRRRVPKDTHNLEQHLVRTEPVHDGNFTYIEVGLSKATDAETSRYGNVQEYGSSSMAAQPYIRPTIDSDLRKARKAMRERFDAEFGE